MGNHQLELVDDSPMTNVPEANSEHRSAEPNGGGLAKRWSKPIILVALIGSGLVLWQMFGEYVGLEYLSTKEAELRTFQSEHPILVYGIAFTVYVVMAGLSIPGAAALSLVYAWYFGFARGVVLVSFASTAGATIAFLLSRHLFRDAVMSRFSERLDSFNEQLEKDGAFYLLWLRLVPLVPFFVINLVMGLTPLSTRTYWWVSQLGMLPGTMVYVYAGSRVPSLVELAENGISSVLSATQLAQLAFAFGLLGTFPIIARKLLNRVTAQRTPNSLE